MKCERNLCAVVIPIYKLELSEYELHSLRQFVRIFSKRDIFVLAPDRLRGSLIDTLGQQGPSLCGIQHTWFSDEYFCNVRSYNRLMLDPAFYQKFIDYEYILIAQTDAYVFDDQLDEFAAYEYDYYGAPWFEGYDRAGATSTMLSYCGNGGFSMRKVKSFLQVLEFSNHPAEPLSFYFERLNKVSAKAYPLRFIQHAIDFIFHNKVQNFWKNTENYEDYFWARCANHIVPKFRSAPPEIAIKFSFETNPKQLYEMNSCKLPMGCHGWWKYNLEFWEKIIFSGSQKS